MTDTLSSPSRVSSGSAEGDGPTEAPPAPPYAASSPAERLDAVTELSGAIAALQAELGRIVVAVEDAEDHMADGATDVAAWLVMVTGLNRRHAREAVRVARALESLPELRAVFGAGAVSFDQIRPITRFATAETDAELARQLPGWSAAQAENLARRLTPKPDDEATSARTRRELHWRPDHKAGGFRYRGFLPTDQGAAVNAALTDLAEKAGPDAESGQWDPFAARCADALHHLAVGDRHPGQAALAVLHVDAATVAQAAAEDVARSGDSATDDVAGSDRSSGAGPTTGAADPSGPPTSPSGCSPETRPADPAGPADPDDRGSTGARGDTAAGAGAAPEDVPPSAEGGSTAGPDFDDPEVMRSGGPEVLGSGGPEVLGSADADGYSLPGSAGSTCAPPAPPSGGPVAPNGILDGMAIGRDTVLRYLCDCDIEFSVEGPHGTTVGIGRRSRAFPDWMRRHIEARDGTCRFPGCERPIRHIHHNRHWTRDQGPTDSHNCEGFCWAHHHLVHEGRWAVSGDADGEITLTSPYGRRLTSRRQPIRPTTRAAAARIAGTTLTVAPRSGSPGRGADPRPP